MGLRSAVYGRLSSVTLLQALLRSSAKLADVQIFGPIWSCTPFLQYFVAFWAIDSDFISEDNF